MSGAPETSAEASNETKKSLFTAVAVCTALCLGGALLLYAPTYFGLLPSLSPSKDSGAGFIEFFGVLSLLAGTIGMPMSLYYIAQSKELSYLRAGIFCLIISVILTVIAHFCDPIGGGISKFFGLVFITFSIYYTLQRFPNLLMLPNAKQVRKSPQRRPTKKQSASYSGTKSTSRLDTDKNDLFTLLASIFTLLAALTQIIVLVLPAFIHG